MTDFKNDPETSESPQAVDTNKHELEKASLLQNRRIKDSVKSLVDGIDLPTAEEIDPEFDWQEAARQLKKQEEVAAQNALLQQERALQEAIALERFQQEERLKAVTSQEESAPSVETSSEDQTTLGNDRLNEILAATVPTVSPTETRELTDVDLSGFTVPIPIKDIHSAIDDLDAAEKRTGPVMVDLPDPIDKDQERASESESQEADETDDETTNLAPKTEPSVNLDHLDDDKEDDDLEEELDMAIKNRRRAQKREKKKKTLARRITTRFIIFLLLLILAAGAYGAYYVKTSLEPMDKSAKKYVSVEVPEGASSKQVGQILQKNGIIKDATVFNYYTKFKNVSNLQSGYYNFSASMSIDDIIKQLEAGGTPQPTDPSAGKIVIPEGYTIEQIASAVESNAQTQTKGDKTPYTSKEFLALMKNDEFIKKMQKKYPKLLADLPKKSDVKYQLEGYLFPATYDYSKKLTMEGLVDQMLATMDSYLAEYYDKIESSKYNVNQTLALASLVEKEGQTDEDRRNIASVFYNRLNSDMPLQSNIAILYAQGKLGKETSLKEDANIDTNIKSPYNIYTNKGLMPGPVDSPSLSAIEAVISPADTKYLYFVADVETGKVYYTDNYDEHQKNVETYVNSKVSKDK